jgi:hypothetical protein
MDDKFLYQLREAPHPKFAKSLYIQLAQHEKKPDWKSGIRSLISRPNTKPKYVLWAGLTVAALMFLASISPVRALVQEVITTLGGQAFLVTEDYPHFGEPERIVRPQETSLDEALAAFPYSVTLPTYVPEGFTLDEDHASLYTGDQGEPFSETVIMQWKSAERPILTLNISDHDWNSTSEIVAPDSTEEILLEDGSSAVLIRGGWNYDQRAWDRTMGIMRLRWQTGSLSYELQSNSEELSAEQLIAIASSTLE